MANQHYKCPRCGGILLLHYTLADTTGPDWPPKCWDCDCDLEMFPQQMLTDLRTDGEGQKEFQKFSVYREMPVKGGGRAQVCEEIDSLHKLRQVERDSEQRYRNGEGEPLRFRMATQNGSNRDVPSFGREGSIGERHYDSGAAPTKRMGVTRHGTKKPRISVAKHGGASPLKG